MNNRKVHERTALKEEEARARIAQLRAEEARALAETEKLRFDQLCEPVAIKQEETLARIAQIRAEEARAFAEAEKARFDQRTWAHPSTWMLFFGAIGGLGTAVFQWQKSELNADRALLNADKATVELEHRREALLATSTQLENKLLALGEAETSFAALQVALETTQASLKTAQKRVESLQITEAEKLQVISDLEIAEKHMRDATLRARDAGLMAKSAQNTIKDASGRLWNLHIGVDADQQWRFEAQVSGSRPDYIQVDLLDGAGNVINSSHSRGPSATVDVEAVPTVKSVMVTAAAGGVGVSSTFAVR